MKIKAAGLALLALAAMPFAATAQEYPSRQITLVVPFTPGGSNDVIGRYLAEALSKEWNQPVVVENRPGAGSAIGSGHVAKSTPDGHTLLFTSGTFTTNAAIQTNLPFDPINDLIPVAPTAAAQFMLVGGSRVQAETLTDLIEEAKSREFFYATTGVGSSPQFAAELVAERMGITMTPVHYKGSTEPVIDMIGGRVDVYVGTVPALLGSVQEKQIKAFGVSSAERIASAPDIPTLAEGGLEGAETSQWWGVFVAAGTPDPIVEKLNATIVQLMSSPEAGEFLTKLGTSSPQPMNAAEFKEMVHDELANWKKLAVERDIRIE